MPEALAAVKRALGTNAVILGTRTLADGGWPGWRRRDRVEITAAPPETSTRAPRVRAAAARATPRSGPMPRSDVSAADEQPAAGSPSAAEAPPEPAALPPTLYPCYVQLVQNAVADELAERLVRQAADDERAHGHPDAAALRTAVGRYIARMIPEPAGVTLAAGTPRRVALVGPSGGGKTLTAAKLATLFRLREEKRVALLSIDMHRLDAREQLRRFADALDVPFHVAQTIGDVKQVLRGLGSVDLLLIDTPGVGLREQARFARLAALLRAARPDEIHLVLPASLAPDVQLRVAQSFQPLGVAKLILTRLDELVGLGVVLNVIDRLELGVSYLTTGQNVPGDIQEACGGRVAELLCLVKETDE